MSVSLAKYPRVPRMHRGMVEPVSQAPDLSPFEREVARANQLNAARRIQRGLTR